MKTIRKNILLLTFSTMLVAACTDADKSATDAEEGAVTKNVTENTAEEKNQENTSAKTKDDYLTMLHAMEDADKNETAEMTTVKMIEQEEARLKRWDDMLNEIYGLLKEQLSADEMEKLRIEQLDWIEARDTSAKEASLKFQGGSMESLEYVATQATLTKDRCYELVAGYMD